MEAVKKHVILLAAGKPAHGKLPSALFQSPYSRRQGPILDWLLSYFPESEWRRELVLGYQAMELARRYPCCDVSINPDWETTGSLQSMYSALSRSESHSVLVSYTDVIYEHSAVSRITEQEGDAVVLVDGTAGRRYEGRSVVDRDNADWVRVDGGGRLTDSESDTRKEFSGLILLREHAVKTIKELWEREGTSFGKMRLGPLCTKLSQAGLMVTTVDVEGKWAELNAPQDLAHFLMGTKAGTLNRVAPLLRHSSVPQQTVFSVAEWNSNAEDIFRHIQDSFTTRVAVRSSSRREDTWSSSNAGCFDSVLDVDSSDAEMLAKSIEKVIASYGDQAGTTDEVLVQRMVEHVACAGVAFTRTLERGAPYVVVNYDVSGSTSGVTSGKGADLGVMYRRRNGTPIAVTSKGRDMTALLTALDELESLFGYDALDVEFAIDADEVVWLLQVRPIVVDYSEWRMDDGRVHAAIDMAKNRFIQAQEPAPFAPGSWAPFSIMTDWNPAEIIGTRPTRLAFSLYRYLVTDEIWARQRAEFGYSDVRPCPLIRLFAGHPYVDIRASFASFIPAALSDDLAAKLVDYYLSVLRKRPELHDKAELEILFTCLTPDFSLKSGRLLDAGFSGEEMHALRTALREITWNAFGMAERQAAAIPALEERRKRIGHAVRFPLERAAFLLEECKRATLLFSHMARLGFVAADILDALVRTGIITRERKSDFLRSTRTVASAIRDDAFTVKRGHMPMEEFVSRYGHLRPGTYNIAVPRYASNPQLFLRNLVNEAQQGDSPTFSWSDPEIKDVAAVMADLGLPVTMEKLDTFFRTAIEGREFSKFVFTRHLSDALECIVDWGMSVGFSREEMAFISITDVLAARVGQSSSDAALWLKSRIEEGREEMELAMAVEMPPLLFRPEDFDLFFLPDDLPNFIGSRAVSGVVKVLDENIGDTPQLANKILLTMQADPGYDWIFGHSPLGLVTCYGGANSHMAVRAAELGLPAAIGIGEKRFALLKSSRKLCLDPANGRLETLY